MSVIKQISVFNGSDWSTGDIGADASNIDISSAILGSGTNVQSALTTIGNEIGTTAIPSELGTTITGAINTLNIKLVPNTATQDGYVLSPSGTAHANQVWKTNADGVPAWRADANTTYSAATTSTAGLMSAADKIKINKLANDTLKIVSVAIPNSSINAYSSAEFNQTFTIPSGYSLAAYTWFIDGNGTTSSAYIGNCFIYNIWTSGSKVYVQVHNTASAAAKVTVHANIWYYKNFS